MNQTTLSRRNLTSFNIDKTQTLFFKCWNLEFHVNYFRWKAVNYERLKRVRSSSVKITMESPEEQISDGDASGKYSNAGDRKSVVIYGARLGLPGEQMPVNLIVMAQNFLRWE